MKEDFLARLIGLLINRLAWNGWPDKTPFMIVNDKIMKAKLLGRGDYDDGWPEDFNPTTATEQDVVREMKTEATYARYASWIHKVRFKLTRAEFNHQLQKLLAEGEQYGFSIELPEELLNGTWFDGHALDNIPTEYGSSWGSC